MSDITITDCTSSFGEKTMIQKKCSTWNDVLRAHNLPVRQGHDGSINSPRPPDFPIAKKLRLAGYDVDYIRHLPEFQHWNDPQSGHEAFLHDTDLLNPESATYVPLVYLFVRGPVDRSWYDKSPIAPHIKRQSELQKTIESKRRRITQNNLINKTLEADVALHEGELRRCNDRIERYEQVYHNASTAAEYENIESDAEACVGLR